MRIEKISIIVVIFFFAVFCKGNSPNAPVTDQYYVMSTSGLNMRVAPNKNAQIIQTIPFGTKVSAPVWAVLESLPKTEVVNGLKGAWISVTHDGKTGFVFSGYLSRMPPPTPNSDGCVIDQYFKVNYGVVETDVEQKNVRSAWAKRFGNELINFKRIKRVYGKNIVLIQEGASDFWFQTYTFQDFTIQELFLFSSTCMKPSEQRFHLDGKKSMEVYGEGPCGLKIYLGTNELPTLEWACSG